MVLMMTDTNGAREAVTRAVYGVLPFDWQADAILAALKPIIAAEIRAWAERGLSGSNEINSHYWRGVSFTLGALKSDAPAIASRICGGEA